MAIGIETLENLLGADEPSGTFHDSRLKSLSINFHEKLLSADFDVCVGGPHGTDERAREQYRPGRLRVEGLQFWFMEPPTTTANEWTVYPWLTDDGPLSSCPTDAAKVLMQRAAGKQFAWYFYFADLNTFAYCAGDRVSFEWT
jgi:hypothetical protein